MSSITKKKQRETRKGATFVVCNDKTCRLCDKTQIEIEERLHLHVTKTLDKKQ